MSGLSLDGFVDLLNDIVDDVVEAAVTDLSDPDVRTGLKSLIDTKASQMLGVDVHMPLVRPFWDRFTSGIYDQLLDYAGVAISDPPDSVDVAADFAKEKISTLQESSSKKIDSIADTLKKRLAEKKAQQSV